MPPVPSGRNFRMFSAHQGPSGRCAGADGSSKNRIAGAQGAQEGPGLHEEDQGQGEHDLDAESGQESFAERVEPVLHPLGRATPRAHPLSPIFESHVVRVVDDGRDHDQ
eukprot:6093457-Pyramimonas_sp.AAC.1